jgi:hypothetical protein
MIAIIQANIKHQKKQKAGAFGKRIRQAVSTSSEYASGNNAVNSPEQNLENSLSAQDSDCHTPGSQRTPHLLRSNYDKWENLTSSILVRQYEQNESQSILAFFKKVEAKAGVTLSKEEKSRYFQDFIGRAEATGTLKSSDVEDLLASPDYGFDVTQPNIAEMIKHKLNFENVLSTSGPFTQIECDIDNLTFEFFLSLACDLKRKKENQAHSMTDLRQMLPLDPEGAFRQCWDLLCMLLLLYCSFYVPFGIAFLESSSGLHSRMSPSEVFGLFVDTVFMIDIGLSFVTAVENEGAIIRDTRLIARHYARTWLAPDLAGSFPFDTVLTSLLDEGAGGAGSTTFIRALRFVRMLKLVRALKFVSRLNKLKSREGFEALAPAIGVSSSVFALAFTAHLLGCLFTMILAAEPEGDNWLASYGADLPAADTATRYVVALYWAMVSITTMGYGDVVPVTHVERIFGLVTALVGAVVFSFCMGNVASLIAQAR